MSTAGNIIDGLKGKKVSGYGYVHESSVSEINEAKIDKRLEKVIEFVNDTEIDEDEWKTMRGAHILVDDKGGIKAGGPEKMREKASKEEIEAGVKDANAKSKKSNKSRFSEGEEKMLRKSFSGSGQDKKKALFSLMRNNNEEVFGSIKKENPEMYNELMKADTQDVIDTLARNISNGSAKIKDSMSKDKKKKLKSAIDSHIKNLDKMKSVNTDDINSEDGFVKWASDMMDAHKDIAKSQMEIMKLLW